MKSLKVLLMMAIPVFMLSCNEGKNKNKENQDNKDNQENKGTNQGMDRDTLNQGSLIIFQVKKELNSTRHT